MKAFVLLQINETHLAAQTMIQAISIDPDNKYFWDTLDWRSKVFQASKDERELLRLYALLHNSGQHGRDPLSYDIVKRLDEFNRLDSLTEILGMVGDEIPAYQSIELLRDRKRDDLALAMLTAWYGFPPDLGKLSDRLDATWWLDNYAQALVGLGRSKDAMEISRLIIQIYEDAHPRLRDLRNHGALQPGTPYLFNQYSDSKVVRDFYFEYYLGALETAGFRQDAERFRQDAERARNAPA